MLIVTTVGNENTTETWCIWDTEDYFNREAMVNWIRTKATKLKHIKSYHNDMFIALE